MSHTMASTSPLSGRKAVSASSLRAEISLLEILERGEQEQAAFEALPAEEQARILAEREAEREAARLARTCEHCGCDPEEHGG